MPLLARSVPTPVTIAVGRGTIARLTEVLADGRISTGGRIAVALGPGHGHDIADLVDKAVPTATVLPLEGGTLDAALDLIGRLRSGRYDAVVGIGGGKALDAAKYAASMVGRPFVAVATALSNDGVASPVASLDSHGRRASYGVHIPIAVIVDIDYVLHSPVEHRRSGVGDVVSNLAALADWRLAAAVTGEQLDGLAVTLARSAAEAVITGDTGCDDGAFLTTLAESLILSGSAMTVAGTSRPCSGACHEISHALDASHGSPGPHGHQVALGALFAAWLHGDGELVGRLESCLRRHDLPRTPGDLGLTADEFCAAVAEAPHTRPARFTVLEHLAMDHRQIKEQVDAFIATFDR